MRQWMYACVIISAGACAANAAQAASLFFSPAEGASLVGKTVVLNVLVTTEEAINAVSGTISFPQDAVKAESISKKGSLIDWWTVGRAIDNVKGTVTFEGVSLKGFTGARGKVLAITFKILKAVPITISFTAGSVLVNDGSGNNVLSDMGRARFAAEEKKAAPAQAAAPPQKSASPTGVIKPIMLGGTHTVVLKTKNAAGREVFASAPFEVRALEAPVVRLAGVPGKPREQMVVGHANYPYAVIRVTFAREGGEDLLYEETRVGSRGAFAMKINPSLPQGVYTARAEVIDGRGARSAQSNALMVFNEKSAAMPFSLLAWLVAICGTLTIVFAWRVRRPAI